MKVLWVGDAGVPTGFGRVTQAIVPQLQANGCDVSILGLVHTGDPDPTAIAPIYPARAGGGDFHGFARIREIVGRVKPDVVVAFNDAWVVAEYQKHLSRVPALDVPVVGYVPVDGQLGYPFGEHLNGLAHLVTYTAFGAREMRRTGFQGSISVIPHGVDLRTFVPMDRIEARRMTGLDQFVPDDGLLVTHVNRNQWRKRFDLTLAAFAELRRLDPHLNVYLLLHCRAKEVHGWDLDELVRWFGLEGRVAISDPDRPQDGGLAMASDDWVRAIYASGDLGLSTAMGEGWGLTTMEGMALERAQLVPDASALAEWPGEAVARVPAPGLFVVTGCQNIVHRVVDPVTVAAALHSWLRDGAGRAAMAQAGRARVEDPAFRWEAIGSAFHGVLEAVCPGVAVPS